MWQRTFDKHFERYLDLDGECAMQMMMVLRRFGFRG